VENRNRIVLGLLWLVLTCISAMAQSTAGITGNVKDQTGAVLPGVEVTGTQTATAAKRTVVTDEAGLYIFTNLPIGPYMIEAGLPGFRTYVQTGIVLQVNANPAIPIVMQIGQVAEQVEVSADAALAETHSSSIGTVVDNQRILEMPLNGRNATELIFLAGMATPAGALNSVRNYPTISISVAGGTGLGVTYTLDGSNHNDAYNNLNLPMPFPDALQEFKVETSALAAQYGFHSSAQVNAVTKSGTNQFHGDVFEFLRNGSLNARNFFASARDTLKRNQFGGVLGGPIKKNKLFFFGGYQGTTQRSAPTQNTAYVPTADMLAGDFTAIASPACNSGKQVTLAAAQGFANNTISPSRFSPAALIIQKRLPTTIDPCGKVLYGLRNNSDENMFVAKIDYQRNDKHSMFGRLYVTNLNQPTTYDGKNALTLNTAASHFRVSSLTLGDTYLLGAREVNSLHIGVNRVYAPKITDDFGTWQQLGVNASSFLRPTVRLSVTGSGFNIGSGNSIFGLANTGPNYNVADDLSLIRGNHQFAFGGSMIHILLNSKTGLNATGNFTFNGTVTGLSLADFLLGKAVTWSQGNLAEYYNRAYDVALYAQDSWKLSSRLTINYGLRWEPFLPVYSKFGLYSHFDQQNFDKNIRSNVYVNAPAGEVFPGDSQWPSGKSLGKNRYMEFLPRFGLIWDPTGDGKTTIRAAFGRLNDRINLLSTTGFAQNAPYGNNISLSNVDLASPWASYPGGNPLPIPLTKDISFPTFATTTTVPFDWKPMTLNQWNLSVQRQIGADWLVSVNYVGNNTSHLMTSAEENPAIFLGLGPCTLPGPNGTATSYAACSTTTNTNQRRRLYLQNPNLGQYYSVVARWDDGGTGSYNGLYLAAQKRLSHGMSLLTNYTWSHCISDNWNQFPGNAGGSTGIPGNRKGDRGNCAPSDQRHVFNLSGIVQTPKFKNRTVQTLANNWQFSPIVRLRSGQWFSVTTGVDNALNGTTGQRATMTGQNPYAPEKTVDHWLNPAAFASPTPGTYGNQGANSLVGPGTIQVDLGVSRTFAVGEGRTIQIRAESFNLPNHTNPNNPVAATNNTTAFGKIQTAGDPRIIQFGVKVGF